MCTYRICLPLHWWDGSLEVGFLGQKVNVYVISPPEELSHFVFYQPCLEAFVPWGNRWPDWSRKALLPLTMEIGSGPSWPMGMSGGNFCENIRTEKLSLPGNRSASCKPQASGGCHVKKAWSGMTSTKKEQHPETQRALR